MYRVNYKLITLAFFLQIITGVLWYASTPTSFLGRSIFDDVNQRPTIEMTFFFVFSALVYLLFIAWLLAKVERMSAFGRFFLVMGMWVCVVLPNYFFVSLYLELDRIESIYFLSYSLINTFLAALILPLGSSSRSIFKD